jgi:uncharacterized protein YycO
MLFRITSSIVALVFLSCEIAQEQKSATTPPLQQTISHTFKEGDVIFQTSSSAQSRAIQLATHSKYSHCGIITWRSGSCYVYEAVQPIKVTPVKEWILRGEEHHYVVKRMKDSTKLTQSILLKMQEAGKVYNGKDYDLYFGWSDDKIYCSELVWKIYHNGAGIDLATPMKLKEFDLTNPLVKQKLKERYGDNIPLEEPAISPGQLYESKYLETAFSE